MNASCILPPTARDFEIHRLHLVEHLSTRRIAEKFCISQTRVRQLAARVCQWLAAALPLKTDADIEREKRLAQHLAADQLQHQIEKLQILWDATNDPKYLRQQTRAILALARLGVLPGAIDSLAAEFCDSYDISHEIPNPESQIPDSHSLQSEIHNPQSAISPPPPTGDCSPCAASPSAASPPLTELAAATRSSETSSEPPLQLSQLEIEGLAMMERRLLTLLDDTSPAEHDRRASLEQTLARIRQNRANLSLQLSPQIVGVSLSVPGDSIPAAAPAHAAGT